MVHSSQGIRTKVVDMLEGSIGNLKMPPNPFLSSLQYMPIEDDNPSQLLISESMERS